jgi:hypothetical protein
MELINFERMGGHLTFRDIQLILVKLSVFFRPTYEQSFTASEDLVVLKSEVQSVETGKHLAQAESLDLQRQKLTVITKAFEDREVKDLAFDLGKLSVDLFSKFIARVSESLCSLGEN